MSIKHFLICPECGRVPCSPSDPPLYTCPRCGWEDGTTQLQALREEQTDTGFQYSGRPFPPVDAPNPALERHYPPSEPARMLMLESQRANLSNPVVRAFMDGVEYPVRLEDGHAELHWVEETRLGVTPGGGGGGGRVKKAGKPPAPWRAGERWLDLP